MFHFFTFLTITCLVNVSCCHVLWENSNSLQPVHGLYVKPSIDGTTGDLYVAASEDNGIKSQWLTDQPINFLPASSQSPPQTIPVQFSSSITRTTSPNEETITSQRQAIATSPAVRYAYALPMPTPDSNLMPPYPYVLPTNPTVGGSNIPYCSDSLIQPYPPFQYFYPPIVTAMANAMNGLKLEDDSNKGSQNLVTPSTPYLPHAPYGYPYPYQYVMVDPNYWSQSQSNLQPTTTSKTSSETS